ncbi:hypothetical protein RDABS01_039613 [Bienertia sinuspersici]
MSTRLEKRPYLVYVLLHQDVQTCPSCCKCNCHLLLNMGKEFVAAAAELMPDCGVNRQLVELLSVRAPSPEKKLKLLKEIAEEHELEWDPSPSESELFKSHEDLLNGPKQFVSGSKVPLPGQKHDEVLQSTSIQGANEDSGSEENYDQLEFPEVPKVPLRPSADAVLTPPPQQSENSSFQSQPSNIDLEDKLQSVKLESPESSATFGEAKQFLPFISPPSSLPTVAHSVEDRSSQSPPPVSKTDADMGLHDVLAAAMAAAESAERAAAAARSAASLAEVRISELSKSRSVIQSPESDVENPFHASSDNLSAATEKLQVDDRDASADDDTSNSWIPGKSFEDDQQSNSLKHTTNGEHALKQELPYHQPQRIPSMDDDPDFAYPNLFSSQSGNKVSSPYSADNFPSGHGY